MPLYEVSHGTPLTGAQKGQLASAITKLHHELYSSPSYFISVKFTDNSEDKFFIGGKPVATVNQIFGMVRTGSTKTASDFGKVCEKIEIEWKKILGDGAAPVDVFLLRSMDAAVQNGFLLSEPNNDKEWVMANLPAWRKLAAEGHEGFQSVIDEFKL